MGLFDSVAKFFDGNAGIGLGSVLGGPLDSYLASKDAARNQLNFLNKGLDFTKTQYEDSKANFQPYLDAGKNALAATLALAGLSGQDLQNEEIQKLRESPLFDSLRRDREEGALSMASSAGRLGSGGTRQIFDQIEPQLLNDLIQQRLGNLSRITSFGQNSAAGTASLTPSYSNSVSNSYGAIGNNAANNSLLESQYMNSASNGIFDFIKKIGGLSAGGA